MSILHVPTQAHGEMRATITCECGEQHWLLPPRARSPLEAAGMRYIGRVWCTHALRVLHVYERGGTWTLHSA